MDRQLFFDTLETGKVKISRSGTVTTAKLAAETINKGKKAVIVVRSREALSAMRGLLSVFTPELSVGTTEKGKKGHIEKPVWEHKWIFLPPMTERSLSREGWAERFAFLYALRERTADGIVITADNFIPSLPPCNFLDGRSVVVHQGEEVSSDLLLEQLAEWGYERVPMVARAGDMARRGDILDVLPPGYDRPIRMDFFGDTVEEIRIFDFATQRSVGNLEEVTLLPVTPFQGNCKWREGVQSYWNNLFSQKMLSNECRYSLLHALEREDPRLLPGCLYAESTSLTDWFPENAVFFLEGEADLKDFLEEKERHWKEFIRVQSEETSLIQPAHLAVRDSDFTLRYLENKPCVYAEPLRMGLEKTGFDLQEHSFHSFTEVFSTESAGRPWQQMIDGLRKLNSSHKQVILAFSSDRGRAKFLKLAEQDGILPVFRYDPQGRGLFAVIGNFQGGAELAWDNIILLGEDILVPKSENTRTSPSRAFKGMSKYNDLQVGDLLVHRDYGIGKFCGLHHMNPGGGDVENEYLLLEYAEGAKLYLPVDRLSVVQKFQSEGDIPALDKLGSSAWTNSREKVRKAVELVAADLIQMYAWRKIAKGFRYSPINEMYREFEATFGFEETADQVRAINEVLQDMDKPEPMDRLICGDVGFGKTEIAMRAAFRAVCDGRQAAFLCPTTVLAEQHYQTFRARMSGFPVNVGLLSRFVPKNKQKEVLNATERGQIDILIGTHRLLSKDVHIPNLGLLILDEEQRFGVRHKEKLKEMRKNVDALTLTATPIPRTLQLSMSGVRELSVLETAPAERKPVATALIDKNIPEITQIIERELQREGQVFFVHNRVQTLAKTAALVKQMVPNARIGMAHGQMPEKELEDTMHQFWHGEIDVLVCTAIVESGLDFPRANTLIVDNAQMFGLGQLYQLRGRVGRSDRQAFAYFLVNDIRHLPEIARERLRIILEMDYLGAGFQVAMEDLRIRGAGNILGEAQSGHMARVGLDLYLEMLEEAVSKLKGEKTTVHLDTEMNMTVSASIPQNYIEDGKERLKYYKMLSSAVDEEAEQEAEMEIRDRYGAFPVELETFIAALSFKRFVNTKGIARIDIKPSSVSLTWAEGQTKTAPADIVKLACSLDKRAKLHPPATMEIAFLPEMSVAEAVSEIRTQLEKLTPL